MCQTKTRSDYLSSGETGRARIVSLAKDDGGDDSRAKRVIDLSEQEMEIIKYHSSTCYKKFQRDMEKKRKEERYDVGPSSTVDDAENDNHQNRKRLKTHDMKRVCVICGSDRKTIKQQKVHKLLRICENQIAQKLLNAAKLFQDRVYTETAAMCGPEDVFAADIYYHSHCCKEYFNKYNLKIVEIMKSLEAEESVAAGNERLKERFLALGLDFQNTAYSLSFIREKLHEDSTLSSTVTNRTVKQLIIELYGGDVCLTYPSNKRISQMVFSTGRDPQSLVEAMRVSSVQQVATTLAQELKDYRFGLEESFCEPRDLQLSWSMLLKNPPPTWEKFCSHLFHGRQIPRVKIDVVFQILHYALSGGKEPTPLHIMVAEGIHSLTRSKELVTALNHHGICASYNTIRRIDVELAERIITSAGENRVPLPAVLETTSPLNGAMDNFDRNESTLAGTGSTHDTILVLFQNVPVNEEKPSEGSEISTRLRVPQDRISVRLRSTVKCQELIRMGPMKHRGEINASAQDTSTVVTSNDEPNSSTLDEYPVGNVSIASVTNMADLVTTTPQAHPRLTTTSPTTDASSIPSMKSISLDYFLWLVNRSSKRTADENSFVPGFTAVRSSLASLNFHETTKILTPILPYPATTYDAIFTTMINFQDAVKQKGDKYGGLWADEGVYRIAKEIQLLKPDQFGNIFLGLGGFHMEKIVLACLGAYLEPSGIFSVLVETECYGTDTINSVISGSHYSRARTAHSLIHEVIMSLMLEAFQAEYPEKSVLFEDLLVDCQSKEMTTDYWNTKKEQSKAIEEDFHDYLKEKARQSQSFAYWFMYVDELFPIARDLTNSMRSGDWILYLSAVERATSLFFFFGRTNYSRWTPLFLQDCYQLEDKFPLLYSSYMNGGFVVNTNRKGSGVPFDQALEQSYNRPAKVSGGIIGVTRKKDAVALWGIIKHKKDEYVHLLKMQDDVAGELSVHHDFNESSAKKMKELVQEIEDYIQKVCSPFLDLETLKNVLTGEIVSIVDVSKLLCCTNIGAGAFTEFVENRLRDKKVSIHATISKIKYSSPQVSTHSASKTDIKDETIKALMFIEYGRHRGFPAEELLVHEITRSAFFLVDKDGYVKKSVKSQLGTELLKLCPEIDAKGPTIPPPTKAYIIDFMAMVRKIPLKKLVPIVKTFNDFAVALTKIIVNAACNSDEIHVVFDTYKEDSIKNAERKRRGKSNEMIVLDLISPNHRVPVKLENFWSSSVSKTAFQAFYVEWLKTNYDGNKSLYLGISPKAWFVSGRTCISFPSSRLHARRS